jgi:3-dehydroquinate dehydratase type I
MKSHSICIPIQASTLAGLKQKIKKAAPHADMLEIWLDRLPKVDLGVIQKIRKMTARPLIFVNKGPREKGLWKGSEDSRARLLRYAVESGADFIDIGIQTDSLLIEKLLGTVHYLNKKAIISYHNFHRTPPLIELWKKVLKTKKLGADLVKIVITAKKIEDNLVIFELLVKARRKRIPLIAFCMGQQGVLSRIVSPHFGSRISYVALDAKSRTAEGQFTLRK